MTVDNGDIVLGPNNEAVDLHSVLAGETGEILQYLLDQPLPNTIVGRYEHSVSFRFGRAWNDFHDPDKKNYASEAYKRDVINASKEAQGLGVVVGNYTTFEAFKKEALVRLRQRDEHRLYVRTLLKLTTLAEDTAQLSKLTEVYDFVEVNSVWREPAPRGLTRALVSAGVRLVENPETAEADPKQAAELVLPVFTQLIEARKLRSPDEAQVTCRGIAEGLVRSREDRLDTAEVFTGVRLRALLAHEGYEGFGNRPSQQLIEDYNPPPQPTKAGLEKIEGDLRAEGFIGLGDLSEVVDHMPEVILFSIVKIAEHDQVAKTIVAAYDKLRHTREKGDIQLGIPITATIQIANLITDKLNQSLQGDQLLEKFGSQDLGDLPQAFLRILYGIDPSLVVEATKGSLVDGTWLRKAMIYLESWAQKWRDTMGVAGPTLGDHLLLLKAQGWSDNDIAEDVNNMWHRPDSRATVEMRRIVCDPNTRKNRVVYSRLRPGYGAIS